jgi:hypothetical protein
MPRRACSFQCGGGRVGMLLVVGIVVVCNAQNLKFATMRWRQESLPPEPLRVRFQVTSAWKWSSFADAGTGCEAQCKNIAGMVSCAKRCSEEGGNKAAIGDYVTLYDIYSTTAGAPMNKGVPIMFDFGDASTRLTGERVDVSLGTTTRPQPKCRTTGPDFGQCLEAHIQSLGSSTFAI